MEQSSFKHDGNASVIYTITLRKFEFPFNISCQYLGLEHVPARIYFIICFSLLL